MQLSGIGFIRSGDGAGKSRFCQRHGPDKLHWIGRLPGDIRIERDNFRVYIPITTMLIFSAVLSLVLYIIRKML